MFQGFSDKTADFLWGIRLNNDRAWYAEHKEDFQESVQKPLKALSDELYDWFLDQYPQHNMSFHMSRIYRDARRLFGRGPFKDHLWVSFQTGERWENSPCFYFEISPEGYGYGMGFFAPQANLTRRYREQIDRELAHFTGLVERFEAQSEFTLCGEEYARSKGHTGEVIEHWYNKKSCSLSVDKPYDLLCTTHELVQRLKDAFTFLMPYYEFLLRAYVHAD